MIAEESIWVGSTERVAIHKKNDNAYAKEIIQIYLIFMIQQMSFEKQKGRLFLLVKVLYFYEAEIAYDLCENSRHESRFIIMHMRMI